MSRNESTQGPGSDAVERLWKLGKDELIRIVALEKLGGNVRRRTEP